MVSMDPGIQWTKAGLCVGTNSVLVAVFQYSHEVLER